MGANKDSNINGWTECTDDGSNDHPTFARES